MSDAGPETLRRPGQTRRSATTGRHAGMLQHRPECLAIWDLTRASFNTVAGCVLASALFAMVVGKVSNAVVHPRKPEKPALAVADEAPTETAAAAPAEELPPIGPLLAGATAQARQATVMKICSTRHT